MASKSNSKVKGKLPSFNSAKERKEPIRQHYKVATGEKINCLNQKLASPK